PPFAGSFAGSRHLVFPNFPDAQASKLEPVVGLGLLACPSCSSGQLRRLRKLHQFALNSCDNTGSWEDLQQFVQRTSTVCPVRSQKYDFQIWCPFWCPLLNRKWPSKWLIFPIVRHEKEAFLP